MTRHQYRHGRTLDALELRGGTYIPAESVREGDTVLSLSPFHDFIVTDTEGVERGTRLHFDTGSGVYDDGEYLCVIRAGRSCSW